MPSLSWRGKIRIVRFFSHALFPSIPAPFSGHWIGTTVLLRPELRFDHPYDAPAYGKGNRYGQLMLAGNVIFF